MELKGNISFYKLVSVLFLLTVYIQYVQGRVHVMRPLSGSYTFDMSTVPTCNGDTVNTCTITVTNGTKYTFQPNGEPQGDLSYTGYSYSCKITLASVLNIYTGLYTVDVAFKDNTTCSEEFLLTKQVFGLPLSLPVMGNETAFFRIEGDSVQGSECHIIYFNGSAIADDLVENTNFTYWGDKAAGECGIEMYMLSRDMAQSYTLWSYHQTFSLYAEFQVTFVDRTTPDTSFPVFWYIGKIGSISMPRSESTFCDITNPRNQTIHVEGSCQYTKDTFITEADEGTWTFEYGLQGNVEKEVLTTEVFVSKAPEDSDLMMNVSDSSRFEKGVDLICRLYGGTAKSCQFVRPDGKVLVMQEGIGNEKYSYYGNGLKSAADCGLTIRTLEDEDRGEWRCIMVFVSTSDRVEKQRVGFLDAYNRTYRSLPRQNVREVVSKEREVVHLGNQFTLTFEVNEALSYCWFRHPTGHHVPFNALLPVIPDLTLHYVYEEVLQQGVCSITIHNARKNDTGDWTCHMGKVGNEDGDIESTISVHVADTDIIAFNKVVETSTEESTTMKCYSIPLGEPLEYCRFVRPDGKGFSVMPNQTTVLGRYQYEAEGLTLGECGLKITYVDDVDLGEWSCVGRLQTSKRESYDTILLESSDLSVGAIVGIAVGAAVVAILLVGGIFYIVRRKK